MTAIILLFKFSLNIVEISVKNFKVSLPIIEKDNQMNFYSWSRNDPLKINKFGIPEPVSSKIFYPNIVQKVLIQLTVGKLLFCPVL